MGRDSSTNRTGVNTGEVVAGEPIARPAARHRRRRQRRGAARAGGARRARCCIGDMTYRLVRDAVEVEPRRAARAEGEGRAACRPTAGIASRGRRGAGTRQPSAPMVGRDASWRSLRGALRRGRRRAARAHSSPSSARPGSGSRAWSRALAESVGDDAAFVAAAACPTATASRSGRSSRSSRGRADRRRRCRRARRGRSSRTLAGDDGDVGRARRRGHRPVRRPSPGRGDLLGRAQAPRDAGARAAARRRLRRHPLGRADVPRPDRARR